MVTIGRLRGKACCQNTVNALGLILVGLPAECGLHRPLSSPSVERLGTASLLSRRERNQGRRHQRRPELSASSTPARRQGGIAPAKPVDETKATTDLSAYVAQVEVNPYQLTPNGPGAGAADALKGNSPKGKRVRKNKKLIERGFGVRAPSPRRS